MRKKSDTVRYTAKQIKAKIARGEDRTNWRKANAMTGKKLEASIRADVDDVHGNPTGRRPSWASRLRKTISISASTTMCWNGSRPSGRGYQTLMNNVLRAFVQSRQLH